jgi:hypothetical protein
VRPGRSSDLSTIYNYSLFNSNILSHRFGSHQIRAHSMGSNIRPMVGVFVKDANTQKSNQSHTNTHEHPTKAKSIFKLLTHVGPCTELEIFKKYGYPRTPQSKANPHTNSHQYSRAPKQVRKCYLQVIAV